MQENSSAINNTVIQQRETKVQEKEKRQKNIIFYKNTKNISFTTTFVPKELDSDKKPFLQRIVKEKDEDTMHNSYFQKAHTVLSHTHGAFMPYQTKQTDIQKSIIKKFLPIQNQKESQKDFEASSVVITQRLESIKRESQHSDANGFSDKRVEPDTSFIVQNSNQNGGYDTSHSQEDFQESYQELTHPEQSSDMQNFWEKVGQKQNISLRLDKTLVNVHMQTNMIHLSFVTHQSGVLIHTNVQNVIDTIMKENGFDNYKVVLKDKKRRIDVSSAHTKGKVSPQRKSINVKV